jgi:RNA polymerase sigma factor (sigma-70 family)
VKISDPSFNETLKKIVATHESIYPKNRYDIEDIAQTVICNALSLGVVPDFLPAYIKTSIKNEIVNMAHSARAKTGSPLSDEIVATRADNRDSARELNLDVQRAIEESHLEGENVMRLYFIDGFDLQEIAERTKTLRGSAGRKLHRQMKRAKTILSAYEKDFPNGGHLRLSRETERDIKGSPCKQQQ